MFNYTLLLRLMLLQATRAKGEIYNVNLYIVYTHGDLQQTTTSLEHVTQQADQPLRNPYFRRGNMPCG